MFLWCLYLVFKNREECFFSHERKEMVILAYGLYHKISRRNPVFSIICSIIPYASCQRWVIFAMGKKFSSSLFHFCLVILFQWTILLGKYAFYFRTIMWLYMVTQQSMYILKISPSKEAEMGKSYLLTSPCCLLW